ncbi:MULTISPECIES: hypothetical protein [unclassified Brevundimonas]|uniref:hypothetical protein n=1 Tax=unclassified Brevundimonas TaxID=2622653 RepID=UPI000CFE30A5|nr:MULTISPECIES: hypothetical protein [unclassified Brevundimonas]PRA35940.1 hypothetical protein CQ024_00925 [Brevundimonas sp. MYb27]PQZ84431.1 hypothetical protein CQ026_01105 [Brevundimonas sp. MYb31]PRB17666.1 hypothetical protein CQ039_01105 [Brevundimonas sp. MYb52]PRB38037.1 hypothetical protein CQ035_01105 [Brevundimonas sp. MYb46]PRB56181.1 hypothetical protein CQ028_01825 [Brevundimonas sp. MYb33]
MSKDAFGVELARQLYAAERALDMAIAETNDLASLMTRGRIRHRISAMVGQSALEDIGALVAGLTASRNKIVSAHGALKRDAQDLGIGWHAAGPELKPAEDGPVVKTGRLQVVA